MQDLFLPSLHLERARREAWGVGLVSRQALGEALMRHKDPMLSVACSSPQYMRFSKVALWQKASSFEGDEGLMRVMEVQTQSQKA